MKKTYYYYCFGFSIASSFPIEDIRISENKTSDVFFTVKKAPQNRISKNSVCLEKGDLDKYFTINSAQSIVFDPIVYNLERLQKLFLVRSALAHLLIKGGGICLHGSAISYSNRGVVFTGPGGSGKSTIAAAFCKMGYKYLSDDSAFVYDKNGKSQIVADQSNLMLRTDAITNLNISFKKVKRANGKGKYEYESGLSGNTKLPLSRIYCLKPGINQNKIIISKLSRMNSLTLLLKNSGSRFALLKNRYNNEIFDFFSNIAARVPFILVKYPKNSSLIMGLAKGIASDCAKYV